MKILNTLRGPKGALIITPLFSLLIAIVLYGSLLLFTTTKIILREKSLEAFIEFIQQGGMERNLAILAGLVSHPGYILGAAGILATLYVAVGLSKLENLSPRDKQKIQITHYGVSNISYCLSVYSLICIYLWYYQEHPTAIQAADVILYLFSYSILILIAMFPHVNKSKIEKKKFELESEVEELKTKYHNIENVCEISVLEAARIVESPFYRIKILFQSSILYHIKPILLILPASASMVILAFSRNEIGENYIYYFVFAIFLFIGVLLSALLVIYFIMEISYEEKIKNIRLGESTGINLSKIIPYILLIMVLTISVILLLNNYSVLYMALSENNSRTESHAWLVLLTCLFSVCSWRGIKPLYESYALYLSTGKLSDSIDKYVIQSDINSKRKEIDEIDSLLRSTSSN